MSEQLKAEDKVIAKAFGEIMTAIITRAEERWGRNPLNLSDRSEPATKARQDISVVMRELGIKYRHIAARLGQNTKASTPHNAVVRFWKHDPEYRAERLRPYLDFLDEERAEEVRMTRERKEKRRIRTKENLTPRSSAVPVVKEMQHLSRTAQLQGWAAATAKYYGFTYEQLLSSDWSANCARGVAYYLAYKNVHCTAKNIAELFGQCPDRVRTTIGAVANALPTDDLLVFDIRMVQDSVSPGSAPPLPDRSASGVGIRNYQKVAEAWNAQHPEQPIGRQTAMNVAKRAQAKVLEKVKEDPYLAEAFREIMGEGGAEEAEIELFGLPGRAQTAQS